MQDSTTRPITAEQIAKDKMEYLCEHPGACAEGNVNGWRNIRYVDGQWRAVQWPGEPHWKTYVEGMVLREGAVLSWMLNKPASIISVVEANVGDRNIWNQAKKQDVFGDSERCFWCGASDNKKPLTVYKTVDDGTVPLCNSCHETWEESDEIEKRVCVVSV